VIFCSQQQVNRSNFCPAKKGLSSAVDSITQLDSWQHLKTLQDLMTATTDDPEASPYQHVAPVDYTQHFGQEGHARQLASLRVLLSAFTGVPGIIGLHGGLPPADAFPFTEMSFTLRDGTKMQITDPAQVNYLLHRHLRNAKVTTLELAFQPTNHDLALQVAAAQQYSVTLRGYPALYEWVKKHTWALHSPPADHDIVVTSGSNHTIEASRQSLCSAFEGPYNPCTVFMSLVVQHASPLVTMLLHHYAAASKVRPQECNSSIACSMLITIKPGVWSPYYNTEMS